MVKLFHVKMKTELHFDLNKTDVNDALSQIQIIELNFFFFYLVTLFVDTFQ